MITIFIIHLVLFLIPLRYFFKKKWVFDETSSKDILNLISILWDGLVCLIYIWVYYKIFTLNNIYV